MFSRPKIAQFVKANSKKLAVGVAVLSTAALAGSNIVSASEGGLQPPAWPWSHGGMGDSFDAASVRRGYKVYSEVCASCHSMRRIAFRHMVDVCFTEKEAKKIAAAVEIKDTDMEGNEITRPGKLPDYFPDPYPNEPQARAANNGAYPPDLSLIVRGRPDHEDYIFSLLTGYQEPPPGVSIREGLHYNPYFPGGAIAMTPPLSDNTVDFEDTDPSVVPTRAQLAKDVVTFLTWTSNYEQERRRKLGLKALVGLTTLAGFLWYYKRFRWSVLKSRRVFFEK